MLSQLPSIKEAPKKLRGDEVSKERSGGAGLNNPDKAAEKDFTPRYDISGDEDSAQKQKPKNN